MNDDKWINVDPRTKKLNLRFRVRGFSRQFYISSGLKDNKTNREILRARKEIIERDIALGRFDSTLVSYRFGEYKTPIKNNECLSISDLWSNFVIFQSQHLEQSTIEADYKTTTKIINDLPLQSVNDPVSIRDVLLKKYSYHTAYKSLQAFSRCCKWAVNSGLIELNPFEPIQLPKPKKRSNENTTEAYTLEQRDQVITAFESHSKFSHYAPLIKFLFWTGCRPGEAFALTWEDVSRDFCKISINKAYASNIHSLKGTKNGRRRTFACSLGSKLQLLLAELARMQPNQNELLFTSKSGLQMNLKLLFAAWNGRYDQGRFYKGVVKELADCGVVPYLKVYSTRHTFATWAIATGSSPEKVAYWLGDDIKTVLSYYCHPDVTKTECPDF